MTDPQRDAAIADRALVKRRAASALRQAGRKHLADLGLRLAGSSPRQWLGDQAWWLINVEFQSSSWSVGSYLNVGVQYLWTIKDHRTFGHGNPRVEIAGAGQFVALDGTEDEVLANADAAGRAARTAVLQFAERVRDDDSHLRWLSQQAGAGFWQDFDAAIAAGLVGQGEQASAILRRLVGSLDHTIAWQDALAPECEYLAELACQTEHFRSAIDDRIAETRRQLKLPPRAGRHSPPV